MPDIGVFHPQITEFAVVLLIVGVLARWISLTGKLPFTRPAAAVLLLAGTAAAVLAVQSGLDAHELAERVPGIGGAVNAHQDAGEWARDVFLIVAVFEIAGLAFAAKRPQWRRWAEIASAVVCVAGAATIYRAGDLGGDLVFDWAGGVGIRSGDTADVGHLLTAGLYQEAMVARKSHRPGEADTLLTLLDRLHPTDPFIEMAYAQSLMQDRKDPKSALAVLDGIRTPDSVPLMKARVSFAKVDVFEALKMTDSARATLTALATQFASNPRLSQRIKDRLARLR